MVCRPIGSRYRCDSDIDVDRVRALAGSRRQTLIVVVYTHHPVVSEMSSTLTRFRQVYESCQLEIPRLRPVAPLAQDFACARRGFVEANSEQWVSRPGKLQRSLCFTVIAALQRFHELDQFLSFLRGQTQVEVLVIVLNDFVQRLEAAVVVEATALAAPQSCKRGRAIHMSR